MTPIEFHEFRTFVLDFRAKIIMGWRRIRGLCEQKDQMPVTLWTQWVVDRLAPCVRPGWEPEVEHQAVFGVLYLDKLEAAIEALRRLISRAQNETEDVELDEELLAWIAELPRFAANVPDHSLGTIDLPRACSPARDDLEELQRVLQQWESMRAATAMMLDLHDQLDQAQLHFCQLTHACHRLAEELWLAQTECEEIEQWADDLWRVGRFQLVDVMLGRFSTHFAHRDGSKR